MILIPQQGDRLLLPPPMFRPGLGQTTLDFPGGRLPDASQQEEALTAILHRELHVHAANIQHIQPLNPDGWPVNSSFSNQSL